MKYDIVSKRLLEIGKESILREIIDVQLDEAKLIELPQELLSLNRVDSPLLVEVKDKENYIILLEWQSNWDADKVQDILGYRSRLKKKYHKPVKVSWFFSSQIIVPPAIMKMKNYLSILH
ncbi:MAG: hypothetical protein IEMM0008_0268 [bacterium]|nr:MAG: hypothetical protein IEMM0008_0268 [bacterium]